MRSIPVFEGTPEGKVFDNTLKTLAFTGWGICLGGNGHDDRIGLMLSAPEHLRLVKAGELLKVLGLVTEDGTAKDGFKAEYVTSEQRPYLTYEGRYDYEAAVALAKVASGPTVELAA